MATDPRPIAKNDDARTSKASQKSFRMHLRGGVRLPVVRDVSFRRGGRRMRGARRPVRYRQVVDPAHGLRQLWRRRRRDPGARPRERQRCGTSASGDPRVVLDLRRDQHRLCQPVPPRRAARPGARLSWPNRWSPVVWSRPRRGAARPRCWRGCNLPAALLDLPPATFSGGEKQRVNIARGFLTDHPVLAARRADRVSRCGEPRRRCGDDPREARLRHRHPGHLPRRGGARARGDAHRRRLGLLGAKGGVMPKLSADTPLIHASAEVVRPRRSAAIWRSRRDRGSPRRC